MPSDESRLHSTTLLRRMFRALHARNYRLYVGGQGLSLIGTWMQRVALTWWVYRTTHSAWVLGGVSFAGQIPVLLLAPLTGALVDRWDRKRLLVVTQALAMLQALALAWVVLADAATVGHILVLSVLLGVINAVDMPTRQALIVDLVDQQEDLSNALALNSALTNGARLIGPAMAGLLIVSLGEGRCFLLNGLSYLAILAAIGAMRLPPRALPPPTASVVREAQAGIRYAWSFPPIRAILLLVSAANLLGMPYQLLLPVFASDVLHGDAHTLGMLTAAAGVGAIIGALYMASRTSVLGLGRVLVCSTSLFGVGILSLSFATHLAVAMLALVGISGGMMILSTASNTLLQTIVDEAKRGRVMSLYTMAFMGTMPIGNLLAGGVAAHVGAPQTLRLGAVGCLLSALVFARLLPTLRPMLQPIYVNLGILQAATLQTQTVVDACLHAHH